MRPASLSPRPVRSMRTEIDPGPLGEPLSLSLSPSSQASIKASFAICRGCVGSHGDGEAEVRGDILGGGSAREGSEADSEMTASEITTCGQAETEDNENARGKKRKKLDNKTEEKTHK